MTSGSRTFSVTWRWSWRGRSSVPTGLCWLPAASTSCRPWLGRRKMTWWSACRKRYSMSPCPHRNNAPLLPAWGGKPLCSAGWPEGGWHRCQWLPQHSSGCAFCVWVSCKSLNLDMFTPCQPYDGGKALRCFSSPLSLLLKDLYQTFHYHSLVQGSIRTLISLCSYRQEIWKEWCDSYMAGYCWKIIWAVMLLGVPLLSTPLWQLISLFHFFPLFCSSFRVASSQLPS